MFPTRACKMSVVDMCRLFRAASLRLRAPRCVFQVRARLCFHVSVVAVSCCGRACVTSLWRELFELAAVLCRSLVGDVCVSDAVCCFRRVVTCGTVAV